MSQLLLNHAYGAAAAFIKAFMAQKVHLIIKILDYYFL